MMCGGCRLTFYSDLRFPCPISWVYQQPSLFAYQVGLRLRLLRLAGLRLLSFCFSVNKGPCSTGYLYRVLSMFIWIHRTPQVELVSMCPGSVSRFSPSTAGVLVCPFNLSVTPLTAFGSVRCSICVLYHMGDQITVAQTNGEKSC